MTSPYDNSKSKPSTPYSSAKKPADVTPYRSSEKREKPAASPYPKITVEKPAAATPYTKAKPEQREQRPAERPSQGSTPGGTASVYKITKTAESAGSPGGNKSSSPYGTSFRKKPVKTQKREPNPSRDLALRLLFEASKPTAPGLDHFLAQAAEKKVAEADIRLARLLACGVLQKQNALKRLLDSFLEEPLKDKPAIELSLLLGFEQLLFTERIPAHAIVDETVRLVDSQSKGTGFRGLANAVMRRATEQVEELRKRFESFPWTDRYAVPEALAELTEPVFTDEGEHEAFWRANNERAPLCLRLRNGVEAEIALLLLQEQCPHLPWAEIPECRFQHPEGLIFPASFGSIVSSEIFQNGTLTVEDRGAQIAATIAAPDPEHHRLLDFCASPGGKTSHWADLLPEASITATDVAESKIRRMNETLKRLKLSERVRTLLVDDLLTQIPEGFFDAILVDAPCSGLGTIRRHPEIRLRRSITSILSLQNTQLEILNKAYTLLKPGGILSYVVCTLSNQETVEVAAKIQEQHPDLVCADASPFALDFADAYRLPGTPYFRTTPHQHGCDGFFVARWRKQS
ncbi:MAG: transcription antitermination factor NusB [Sumerlaeia bacterium]